MIILLCLLMCFIFGVLISVCFENGCLAIIIPGTLLLVALIAIPVERIEDKSQIIKFKATQEAIYNGVGLIENTAVNLKIIDCNRWLANIQYWNTTLVDIWILDEVEQLTPLKLRRGQYD